MAIEFKCPGCQKSLRVAEASAGKQARCPGCGSIMVVPNATSSAPAAHGGVRPGGEPAMPPLSRAQPQTNPSIPKPPQPASPQPEVQPQLPPIGDLFGYQEASAGPMHPGQSANPFQSPQSSNVIRQKVSSRHGGITPTRINISDVFSLTWTIFSENALRCILAGVVQLGIIIGAYIVFVLLMAMGQAIVGNAAMILAVPGLLAFSVLALWLQCGNAIFFLNVARGEPAEISDLFAGAAYIGRVFLAGLIMVLIIIGMVLVVEIPIVALGFLAVAAAGPKALIAMILLGYAGYFAAIIAAMINFGQHLHLIVDQNMGAIESFNMSWKITSGNRLTIALIYVILGIGYIIGALCTCGLGIIVIIPFIMLLSAVMYLAMSGQFDSRGDAEDPMPVLTPLH